MYCPSLQAGCPESLATLSEMELSRCKNAIQLLRSETFRTINCVRTAGQGLAGHGLSWPWA